MRNTKSLAFLIGSAVLLAACKTPIPLSEPPKIEERTPVAPLATKQDSNDVATTVVNVDPIDDPKGVLAKRSVYFDYDSYVVREDGQAVVNNHSSYLGKNQSRKILIQGNTDDRGGTEYNLALGQKRAEAVRKAMSSLGVAENQMEAVSLGEEKPKMMGSGEEAWAENRRADIVY
ncbi:peptidoglycan-associated lipoprotein Pal [Massilia glaciei]|uniref:Peptidoglycan-associated lipoprotein n=1 Tax=Massilia glaciei TaxID=1524097 RepID=A0A2U2HKE7_9BURK|nr:peptidoglycan-associated lipoprotein Pal [Massilia glaciei]PWF47906.1 peptidoglycan-associated lipoprotein Pal [Massilia glaciei]